MKIKPIGDRVLLKLAKAETKKGSLYLPEGSTVEMVVKAEVLAVGDGVLNDSANPISMPVKPGDNVMVVNRAGTEVSDGIVLVKADYILAIVEDEPAGIETHMKKRKEKWEAKSKNGKTNRS